MQQFHHPSFNLLTILSLMVFGMINLFIYCYFGKIATDSFEDMADAIYLKMDWQKLSLKHRKYLILLIGNMQRPIYYHGFKIAVVDLTTYIRVSEIQMYFNRNWSWFYFWVCVHIFSYAEQSIRITWSSKRSQPNEIKRDIFTTGKLLHQSERV